MTTTKYLPACKNLIIAWLLTVMAQASFAQQGKHGAKTIGAGASIVNEYTALTADAVMGSTTLKVSSSTLNANSRFVSPLSTGDLIMIIQVQGATINGSPADSTWGAVTAYNSCGLYEFSEVAGVPDATTISLSCVLKNTYTSTGKVQVVRVPRFVALQINNGGILTADGWDGTKGGIVAIEVQGQTIVDSGGTIDASAKGFRGGAKVNAAFAYNISLFASTSSTNGAQKGESIAGYQSEYTGYGGMYGRGAPANGGGGGNSTNSPGGGGANAGVLSAWTGNGNPDTSTPGWVAAWNLEYGGFANATSSGGGRGGYCWAHTTGNPLTQGPGNAGWVGDSRRNHGGKGGRPLDYSTGRIFFGGGGGAGHGNDNNGSRGGNGGGIIYIIANGSVSGMGSVVANGEKGQDSNSGSSSGDGAGGAGGGGTVLISSKSNISGITIQANGGKGGDQLINHVESEGAGGGGGGGYIALSNPISTTEALGGKNGISTSTAMTAFTPNGATMGGNGLAGEILASVPSSVLVATLSNSDSICRGTTVALSAAGGTTYAWSPSAGLSCDTCPQPQANPVLTTTYTVTVSTGSCRAVDSLTITVLVNDVSPGNISAVYDSICPYMEDTVWVTGSAGTVHWQSSFNGISFTDLAVDTLPVYYILNLQQTTYYRVRVNGICGPDSSAAYRVVLNPLPVAMVSAEDTIICPGDSSRICTGNNFTAYQWNTGETSACIWGKVAGPYWLTVTDINNCTAVSSRGSIAAYPVHSISVLVQGDNMVCFNEGNYQWFLDEEAIPGATGETHIAANNGNYTIQVIDTNGCVNKSGIIPVVINGIDLLENSTFHIYPNPFANLLYIRSMENMQVDRIQLYDVAGRIVWNNYPAVTGNLYTIEAPLLTGGMYYIKLQSGGNEYTARVVKW